MKILYLSHSRLKNSVNIVYIKGLLKNNQDVKAYEVDKALRSYWKVAKIVAAGEFDLVIVGYDSPSLVTFSRLFTRKKIVYNALCSVYERMIVARGFYSRFSFHAIYFWLLDFFAISSANKVMLETDSQIEYFIKLFKFPGTKFIRAWTGVDEDNFYYSPNIKKFDTFTVFFRGALMPEAGAEYVVRTAKILEGENIKFIMLSGGMLLNDIKKLISEVKPKNLELKSELLSHEELRILMQKSHLSLGQLSDHPRLNRTIPHKAYESLAMGLPYLTASNKGILELVKDRETCITCEPANAESVAKKILWAINNPKKLNEIAKNGYELFDKKLKSNILGKELMFIIESM